MSEPILVADVGIDSRSAGSEAVYTYRVDSSVKLGAAHFVPLGVRRVLGFVLAVRTIDPADLGFPVSALKDIGPHVYGVDLPEQTIALVHEVSRQTLATLATAVTLVTPPGILDRVVTKWIASGEVQNETLNAAQKETLRVLTESNGIVESKTNPIAVGAKSSLHKLELMGLATRTLAVQAFADRSKQKGLLHLTNDEQKVEKFLTGAGAKSPAQALTVMRMLGSASASFTAQEVKALGGVSDVTVKALVNHGLLEWVDENVQSKIEPPVPNSDQSKAIEAITSAIKQREHERFLLYGVTGSGKTEVYLRAATEALTLGRQVLYLVPEIALTAQVIAQLRARFGSGVVVMHSNMLPSERLENWMAVRTGKVSVVLGARSALFAPFTNLGLIVMDEEHEASYKQENNPRYHTKRLATFLALSFSAPLVMGSATPSIETFYESEKGGVKRLDLPYRTASAQLPTVHIEDLTEMYREKHPSLFSKSLHDLIAATLEQKKQTILFLNRRAYTPFVVCRDCGHRFLCPDCSVSLALHRRDRKLRCHHCGYQENAVDICPDCQGEHVTGFGVGAEKVEEAVKAEFPDARVARLDRDTAKRKGVLEEVFAKFRAGEIDILVGTQMVAKGLDFPNVTLVGVIAADVSLNVPDFRASERTFQLLSQVAGRAGRGQSPGEVVVQTFSPTHASVVCAQTHDYDSIYRFIIAEREEAGYPPFKRLVNIYIIGDVSDEVVNVASQVGVKVRETFPTATVLGPTACPIERRSKMWRRHVLVKLAPDEYPSPLHNALVGFDTKRTRVSIDVDPYNML